MAYQRSNVGELLISGNEDRLYKELVTALGIWRWVFLHSLEKDCIHGLVSCTCTV